jgi:hypothetical protein
LEKEISGSFIVFAAMDTIFAGLGRGYDFKALPANPLRTGLGSVF